MKKYALLILLFCGFFTKVSSQTLSSEEQIRQAVKALPEENRENTKVLGYDANGKLIELQKGGNGFVCLADDPNKNGFSVSCYSADLEPFMARGRELQKEHKTYKEIFDLRESEAKSGKLKLPKNPSTLHVLSGENIEKANYRYVVYIPWATAQTTGLPTKEIVPGAPWIMDPGTHRAHIMITPPAKNK